MNEQPSSNKASSNPLADVEYLRNLQEQYPRLEFIATKLQRLEQLETQVAEYLKFRERQEDNLTQLDAWCRLYRRNG